MVGAYLYGGRRPRRGGRLGVDQVVTTFYGRFVHGCLCFLGNLRRDVVVGVRLVSLRTFVSLRRVEEDGWSTKVSHLSRGENRGHAYASLSVDSYRVSRLGLVLEVAGSSRAFLYIVRAILLYGFQDFVGVDGYFFMVRGGVPPLVCGMFDCSGVVW